jgi:exodeoxyribonuclease VII large subunit
LVLPVRVQGEEASYEIAHAIAQVNRWKLADLIITGRGGGSMEDLWAFNEERVARAIFASTIPVISAVGHEPDVTISDYVADLRAATPSNAAELAVPDAQEMKRRLKNIRVQMEKSLGYQLAEGKRILDRARRSPWLKDPLPIIQESRFLLDYQQQRLVRGLERTQAEQRGRFRHLAASLDALSPLKVLARGYSMVQDDSGKLITSVGQVHRGQALTLRLSDGSVDCRVEDKEG